MRFIKKVKEWFSKIGRKIKEFKERKEKKSSLSWIFSNIDDCVLTAYMEDDELVVKIRPKETPQAA